MRTFPRELAAFREIVDARGAALRQSTFEVLEGLKATPVEHLKVEARAATIGIIVQRVDGGRLRVVVQGFMDNRFFPGQSVALDGFYKNSDGSVAPMPDKEFYEFD